MIHDLQQKIVRLKKQKDICILAHSYMSEEVCEVADFVGDSYALALKAQTVAQGTVIMCGVRFMAETVKMLSPQKRVILSNPQAGCPMAEQFEAEQVLALKASNPDAAVVAYVNTTAQLKAVADVCVTSSSAVKICRALPNKNIIFMPDINLGSYVKSRVTDKNFILMDGGCPIHKGVTVADVQKAKSLHPQALLLVHPECSPAVVALADYVGSTAGITEYAQNSQNRQFIIGTENSILQHLQYKCPDKRFYPLSKRLICHDMRLTTLADVIGCIEGTAGEEIVLTEDLRLKAVKCIERMIALGG